MKITSLACHTTPNDYSVTYALFGNDRIRKFEGIKGPLFSHHVTIDIVGDDEITIDVLIKCLERMKNEHLQN